MLRLLWCLLALCIVVAACEDPPWTSLADAYLLEFFTNRLDGFSQEEREAVVQLIAALMASSQD